MNSQQEIAEVVIDRAALAVKKIVVDDSRLSKPTFVFLHDSLGCITLWRDFPAKVADATKCNTIIYDRQGYGKSSAFHAKRTPRYLLDESEVLLLLLDKLQIKNAILFGMSDGGTIALIAAALEPSRIAGVITEGAHVFVEDVTLDGIRAAIQQWKTTNLRDRLIKYHGEKTDWVFSAWVDTWLMPEYRDWNVENMLAQIRCPVLVIQGESDEYGTEAQVDAIVDQAGGVAEKLMLPGVGHTAHREAPEATFAATVSFVQRHLNGSL